MDPRSVLTTYRINHRHGDGTWAEMTEVRAHHDPAEHDPERGWGRGRIFRCQGCDESVSVVVDAPETPAAER